MGKELKSRLLEAGLRDPEISVSLETFATAEDIAFFHALGNGWFFHAATVAATTQGLASAGQFAGWGRAFEAWNCAAGALADLAWGEAIGRKP